MTDESPGMGPTEDPTPAVESDETASVLDGAGDFTSGEGLVAFAGMVIVAAWLLFGVLANDYWAAWVALVPAAAVALLPRLNRATVERYHPLPMIMKALGFWIALVGLFSVITDLRFANSRLDEPLEVVGALITYAAFAMAFIGARQIKI